MNENLGWHWFFAPVSLVIIFFDDFWLLVFIKRNCYAIVHIFEKCACCCSPIIDDLSIFLESLYKRTILVNNLTHTIKNITPKENIIKQITIAHTTKKTFCSRPFTCAIFKNTDSVLIDLYCANSLDRNKKLNRNILSPINTKCYIIIIAESFCIDIKNSLPHFLFGRICLFLLTILGARLLTYRLIR